MSNELHSALRGNRPDYALGTPLEEWRGPPIVRWRAREALSELFEFDIVLRRLQVEGPFPADRLLDLPATLRIATEASWRNVHGIISEVEELDRTAELTLTRVKLVPHIWRATQRVRSRTFVDRTLRQVLVALLTNATVLHPSGYDGLAEHAAPSPASEPSFDSFVAPAAFYRFDVADAARLDDPTLRSYVVQYNESDFALLSRLLEEEGLSYYFEQHSPNACLVITDRPRFDALHSAHREIAYRSAFKGVGGRDRESVRVLRSRNLLRWGHVEVRDFDPARPQSPMLGIAIDERPSTDQGGPPNIDANVFLEHTYPSRDEAVERPCVTPAVLMQERRAVGRAIRSGIGTSRAMEPGLQFKLIDETGVREEEELVIVSVLTFATQLRPEETALDAEPFGLDGRGHASAIYENTFEAISAGITFRSALSTPRPRIDGVHTAVVAADEMGDPPPEIHRNPEGAVRVRFPWDERREHGVPSSTWVRVSQGWAGAGYGNLFVPRVGQEVLVSYLAGDPERPLIVGRVHNAIQPVEYEKPTISTIKSKSSPNSDGFNEFRFDDDAGNEEVFLHAQKNLNEVVLANHSTSIGGNQSNSVGGNQSDSVDGNQSNTVKGNRTHTITGTEDVTVTGNVTTQYCANELHIVTGTRSTVITGHESLTCVSGRSSTIMAAETLNVQGVRSMVVTGPNTEEIGGPLIVSSPVCLQTHAALFKVTVGGSSLTIDPGSIRLKTPGGSICMLGDTILIDGSIIVVDGGGSVDVKAGGTLKLKGSDVNIFASGTINGKAGAIKLNG